jgi:hypothetical protein
MAAGAVKQQAVSTYRRTRKRTGAPRFAPVVYLARERQAKEKSGSRK